MFPLGLPYARPWVQYPASKKEKEMFSLKKKKKNAYYHH
jgi:hypothetical protein